MNYDCFKCHKHTRSGRYTVHGAWLCVKCSNDEIAEEEQKEAWLSKSNAIEDDPKVDLPSLRTRFSVFKRDGYRCQICGHGAKDGAKLELSHKIAKSKGGRSSKSNLYVLCFNCNRGQSTEDF